MSQQLAAPTELTASTTATTITLSWASVQNATGYVIYSCSDSSDIATTGNTSYTISGVPAKRTFAYRVRAIDSSGEYADSQSVYIEATTGERTTLRSPIISIDSCTETTITISWGAVENARSYRLMYSTNSSDVSILNIPWDVTSHTLTGLTAGTSYFIQVRANNGTSNTFDYTSEYSSSENSSVKAETTRLPIQGVNFASAPVVTASTATIKWFPVTGALGYIVTFNDIDTQIATNDANYIDENSLCFYKATGLGSLSTYSYAIKTILEDPDNPGETIYSASREGTVKTTALVTLPAPVVNPTASATYQTLEVSWERVEGAAGYTFAYRATDANSFKTVEITNPETTSYALIGLTANTSYTVKVRATGDSVETRTSAYGATIDFITDAPPAGVPSIVSSSTTASTATLTWTQVADATGYRVVAGTKAVEVGADATTGTVSGLKPSTSYSASVAAIYNGSVGEAITTSVKTTALLKLYAPTFTLTPCGAGLKVTWDVQPYAEGYTIAYSYGNKSSFTTIKLGSATITSYIVSGLDAETEYKVKIRTDGDGKETRTSSYGSIRKATTGAGTSPTPPTGLSASRVGCAGATLSWDAVDYAASYRLIVYDDTPTEIINTTVQETSYTIADALTRGTNYTASLCAIRTSDNYGSEEATTTFTTPTDSIKLATPTALVYSSLTATSASLNWTDTLDASCYQISYTPTGGATLTTFSNVNSVVLTGLSRETTYSWNVTALGDNDAFLDSETSPSATFTTPSSSPLSTPTGLAVSNITSTSARLSWGAVTNAVGYKVEYRAVGATAWLEATE